MRSQGRLSHESEWTKERQYGARLGAWACQSVKPISLGGMRARHAADQKPEKQND